MVANKSVVKAFRITPEKDIKINLLNLDISDFIDSKLNEKFLLSFHGEIDEKIKEYEKKIKDLIKLKEDLDPKPKTSEELQFFKDTQEILKQHPEMLKARISYYSNQFDKLLLNEKEFKQLLKKYGK